MGETLSDWSAEMVQASMSMAELLAVAWLGGGGTALYMAMMVVDGALCSREMEMDGRRQSMSGSDWKSTRQTVQTLYLPTCKAEKCLIFSGSGTMAWIS